LCSAEKI